MKCMIYLGTALSYITKCFLTKGHWCDTYAFASGFIEKTKYFNILIVILKVSQKNNLMLLDCTNVKAIIIIMKLTHLTSF